MKEKTLKIVLFMLIGEKVIQHLYTCFVLIMKSERYGVIDMTPYRGMSENDLCLYNLILVALFIYLLIYYHANKQLLYKLLYGLAAFDIFAEFVFHGFFYITFSVLFAVMILIVLKKYKKTLVIS